MSWGCCANLGQARHSFRIGPEKKLVALGDGFLKQIYTVKIINLIFFQEFQSSYLTDLKLLVINIFYMKKISVI